MKATDDVLRCLEASFEFPISFANGRESLPERFAKIRSSYASYQRGVDAGLFDWMRGDPYAIADWAAIFTPIEMDAWCEIRCAGIPMWPQFPVGKFFVDFGNPVAKVALECDGKDFHDPVKDAERDRILNGLGWRVIRASGLRCYKTRLMLPVHELHDRGDFVDDGYDEIYHEETLAGLIRELVWIFDELPKKAGVRHA